MPAHIIFFMPDHTKNLGLDTDQTIQSRQQVSGFEKVERKHVEHVNVHKLARCNEESAALGSC